MIFFPQKLWNRVESDQFESVWWDESGTCRVINEELFKKEVLERKTFRIVETKSMKSLIRQLNLYGFNQNRQSVQRSASPPVFLEEENNISLLSKVFQNFHLLAIFYPPAGSQLQKNKTFSIICYLKFKLRFSSIYEHAF